MMHSKVFKTFFTIASVFAVAFAAPKPADKPDLNNEIIPGFVTKNGDTVSASWGGYQASASPSGASAGGNGLGASAGYGTTGVGAAAGVGLVDGEPSKPVSGVYGKPQGPAFANNNGGFFDRIFAIPINVLHSVNTYLNQKQQHQGQGLAHGQQNNSNGGVSATAGSGTYGAGQGPQATAGADYGQQSAGSTTGQGKAGSPMMVQAKPNSNYDQIFNIPITALKSVQNLLNG